ncbi:DEAD/DEAH box helicase, partial [Crocinitomix catalasitica]|nr:DEAD/DEAH box helicase [Crocinitomix catalasitica]
MTFNELGLKEALLSAINSLGFEKPTEIQEQVIPYLIENQGDLVGLASTGTGKTAAFGLPLLNLLELDAKITQGLIICPTRELCVQISKDLINYAKKLAEVNIVAVYGGADISKQIRQLDKGAHIIVATPGRLKDLINRRKVQLRNIDVLILDEADEMLNMGFKEDIDYILEGTPDHKSVWLFSATMPKDVARISTNYMDNPLEVTIGGKNEANKNIVHQYCVVKERDRFNALKAIIDFNPDIYGLIFCRTRRETGMVADKLMTAGYNAEPLHGDLSQAQRDRVMGKFRNKTLQILVATDVAARGIDVDDITHVIHHKLPEEAENYTHRSGRTARAGRTGVSLALINTREGKRIKSIEKIIGDAFELIHIPTSGEIGEKQLLSSVRRLGDVKVNEKAIGKYMPAIMQKLQDFSKEDLVKRFLSAE